MEENKFITYLQSLVEKDDRRALAHLRRGLDQPPGTVPAMYPYVEPFRWQMHNQVQEAIHYQVAALFASHPLRGGTDNFGAHMALARTESGEDALERRFTALLSAHFEDLPSYLRQAIGFLKSRSQPVPVNWNQLFHDLQYWDHEDRWIQKQWASAFWRRAQIVKEPAK